MSNDAGGMIREWMSALVKIIMSSSLGLFERCDTPIVNYKIKESSAQHPGCDDLFSFFGQIIGKALFDRIPLNLCFARTIFKYFTEKPFALDDIQFLDESVFFIFAPRLDL